MPTVFRGALEFFNDIGIYDVVLPFLLVFTIVFAILEKSRVFGVVKVDGTEYTRKNLNAMISFVISFFVVGSTQLVSAINKALAHVVLLLILSISFLILAGSFNKDESYYLKGGWNHFFMIFMFVGVVLIFLNAIGWLGYVYTYVTLHWTSTTVSSLILIILIVLFMMYVTSPPKHAAHRNGMNSINGKKEGS